MENFCAKFLQKSSRITMRNSSDREHGSRPTNVKVYVRVERIKRNPRGKQPRKAQRTRKSLLTARLLSRYSPRSVRQPTRESDHQFSNPFREPPVTLILRGNFRLTLFIIFDVASAVSFSKTFNFSSPVAVHRQFAAATCGVFNAVLNLDTLRLKGN